MIATPPAVPASDPVEVERRVREALAAPPGSPAAHVHVSTSGSTGHPRTVRLAARALRASGEATADRLGGHGQWLAALSPDHVAGLQVVARSVLAGTSPVWLDQSRGFRPADFAAATDALTATRLYTSLVPTQLHRILEDAAHADGAGLAAARRYTAVLVGGAAVPTSLLARARQEGVRVVTTYGMSETAGGCVYDGVPLDGVVVRLRQGRIEISGPVLADGYADDPVATAEAFVEERDATGTVDRWFRTSDLGELSTVDGTVRLRVLGRADDALISGGVNIWPAAVEAVLAGHDGVQEVCVVGLADAEWGSRLVALVTAPAVQPGAEADVLARMRARVTDSLGAPAAPRDLVIVDELPVRGPGKVDRRAAAAVAQARLTPAPTDPTRTDLTR